MNPTILIRSVAATLAATTLLLAQSAPQPRPAARSAVPGNDRMQVRLAEVIAMLEEDDLTPEQRAEAKKKLEEIRARLRSAAAPAPTPPVLPTPATPPAPPAVAAPPAEAVDVIETKPMTRTRRALAPEAQEPAPPKAAKPPKAPKAPKAPKIDVGEPLEVAEVKPVEVRRLGGGEVIVQRKGQQGDDVMVVRPEAVEGQGIRTYTVKGAQGEHEMRVRELKAKADEQQQQVRVLRERAEKLRLDAKELEPMVLRVDAAKAEAKNAEEQVRRARVLFTEAKQRAEADAKAERFKTYTVRERDAQAASEEARTRAVYEKAKDSATFGEFIPARGRLRSKVAEEGDGDDEIRKLIKEMRDEMRAIRKLIEQMRKPSTSSAEKRSAEPGMFGQLAPGDANSRTYSRFVPQGGSSAAGQAGTAPQPSYRSNSVRSRKASSTGSAGGMQSSDSGAQGWFGSTGSGMSGSQALRIHSTGAGGMQSSNAAEIYEYAPGAYSVSTPGAEGGLWRYTGSSDVK